MDITPVVPEGQKIIQSYGPGRFRISGTVYNGPVGVFVDKVVDWIVDGSESVTRFNVFSDFVNRSDEVDILLLGTGDRLVPISASLRAALKERGLSVDVMDTGAACRTYNVLLADGRRVAAALIPLGT